MLEMKMSKPDSSGSKRRPPYLDLTDAVPARALLSAETSEPTSPKTQSHLNLFGPISHESLDYGSKPVEELVALALAKCPDLTGESKEKEDERLRLETLLSTILLQQQVSWNSKIGMMGNHYRECETLRFDLHQEVLKVAISHQVQRGLLGKIVHKDAAIQRKARLAFLGAAETGQLEETFFKDKDMWHSISPMITEYTARSYDNGAFIRACVDQHQKTYVTKFHEDIGEVRLYFSSALHIALYDLQDLSRESLKSQIIVWGQALSGRLNSFFERFEAGRRETLTKSKQALCQEVFNKVNGDIDPLACSEVKPEPNPETTPKLKGKPAHTRLAEIIDGLAVTHKGSDGELRRTQSSPGLSKAECD